MKKLTNTLVAIALALTNSCENGPVPMPTREEVFKKENNGGWGFEYALRTDNLFEIGYESQFVDYNKDGKPDGITFTQNGNATIYVLAYDSCMYKEYDCSVGYRTDLAVKLTPSLDSAMMKYINAAKELRWKYELEKYTQQKRP